MVQIKSCLHCMLEPNKNNISYAEIMVIHIHNHLEHNVFFCSWPCTNCATGENSVQKLPAVRAEKVFDLVWLAAKCAYDLVLL